MITELTPASTPEEVRTAWAEALESGDYGQCQRRLTDFAMDVVGDAAVLRQLFCALGVLQELAYRSGVTKYNANVAHLMGYSGVTDEVAAWAGISSSGLLRESIDNDGTWMGTVMALNDCAEWDFHRIAKEVRNDNLITLELP